jgi:MFS family permease
MDEKGTHEEIEKVTYSELEARPQPAADDDFVHELSVEHRDYLFQRHGTYELNPIPDATDADPLNWPKWKKVTNLALVALHAMMATFNAAAINAAFPAIAADFGISVQRASYLTSLQIAVLGVSPLFWGPLADRYGRRPIFLFSLLAACLCNVGCALSPTYSAMAASRALVAFFICPPSAIGSAVVTETFFKAERAKYMGVWTLLLTLGIPIAPFLMGFVAFAVGYRWIYYVLAIIHAVQLGLYMFLGPETRYLRGKHTALDSSASHTGGLLKFKRIDSAPLTLVVFASPLRFFWRLNVLVPTVAYAVVFLLDNVLITVEIPQLFGEKFHFNVQQIGLQFLSVVVGNILGEQLGGALSDRWMARRTRASGARPAPEYRLWLSYPGTLLGLIGIVVFLAQIDAAPPMHWNITPLVGAAIGAAGTQIVTTILITYSVDCYPQEAARVGIFIAFFRSTLGFIGPFWYVWFRTTLLYVDRTMHRFPPMFDSVGLRASAGICAGLIVCFSLIPIIVLQAIGGKWRPN